MSMTLQTSAQGTYTFAADPSISPPIRKEATRLSAGTWAGATVKDRGFQTAEQGLVGLKLQLTWPIMSGSMFTSLRNYYEHDEENAGLADFPVFDPKERARVLNEKYKVRVDSFDWDEDHLHADYVLGVNMVLDIRGVV
jgi:hypothetical protein